ncbi:D-beta-hydroxybutyrate dehydrogenase, mitochondrial-like [Amphiura filiformis]|uniref:D-beta-hydroxybutyrate dehydrogenase, mitochondrial-like n=1 Tax=Amphiura filiformis TaxID=82378 RepID=UPI003B222339
MAHSAGRLLSFTVLACILVWYLPQWFGAEIASQILGTGVSIIIAYNLSGYFPPSSRFEVVNKAVLVTGCDTGIGHGLAKHLDSLGFCVFAGCLFKDGPGATTLKDTSSNRLTVLQLDVTSDGQVNQAVKDIQQELNKNGKVFWGVVNNAGLICFGEVEWVPVDMFRNVQEVNVWGLIRVTQAFLPLIRRSKGRIINISSITGRFAAGMTSPYIVSKYGVEAISDSLRHELHKWGVKVVIIEPGNYGAATVMFKRDAVTKNLKQVWDRTSDQVKKDYGQEYFEAFTDALSGTSEVGARDNIGPVAEAVADGLTLKYPSERYMPAGLPWQMLVGYLRWCLPESQIVSYTFQEFY